MSDIWANRFQSARWTLRLNLDGHVMHNEKQIPDC